MNENEFVKNNSVPIPENHKKPKNKSSRTSKIAKLILILFIVWWFNNYTLKITKVEIKSDKIKNEVKIAVLSDQHASENIFAIKNSVLIKKIKKMNPDVVFVIGDMHSSNATEN
jgi:predicted MPP superfamily phosphohydrolase